MHVLCLRYPVMASYILSVVLAEFLYTNRLITSFGSSSFTQNVLIKTDTVRIKDFENRIFTATVSRVGIERNVKFLGVSQITDPQGHVLISFDDEETGVGWVDIDPSVADIKAIGTNTDAIADRRPDLYLRIAEEK